MESLFTHLDVLPFTPRLLSQVVQIREDNFFSISKADAGKYLQYHASRPKKVKYAKICSLFAAAKRVSELAATFPEGSDARTTFLDQPLESKQKISALRPYTSTVSK